MDIALDTNSWSSGPANAEAGAGFMHPEWHSLCARLHATHQTWQSLEPAIVGDLAHACGSFDSSTANLLDIFGKTLPAVNPIDSANRKPDGDIVADVVGTSITGD